MPFLRKNFAKGVLATSLSLAGTTLTVNSGHTLPVEAGTMRLVIWDVATYPDPSDDPSVEIVTAEYSGTGTVYNIIRAQENTSPSAHVTGSAVALNMTAAVSVENRYQDEEVRDVIGAILDDGTLGDIRYTYTDNGDATSTIHGDIKTALRNQYDAAYAHVSASGASHSDVVLNTTHRGLTNNPHTVTPAQLSLVIGTDVQAYGAGLDDLSALGSPTSDGQFIVATGAGTYQFESGNTVRTSLGLGTEDSLTFAGLDLTGITDGNIPYMSASGFADSSIKQDGTDIKIGDSTNYTSWSTTGVQTMAGSARVKRYFRIGAALFFKKDSPPEEDIIGIVPVLKFDAGAVNEQAYYSDTIPFRMLAGGDIEVEIDWCYEGGADAGTVVWGVEFINIATGEAVAGGTTTITGKSAGTHASGTLVRTAIDDVANITGSVADDVLAIRVYRDSSDEVNDTLAVDACLIQVRLHFIMDKLGQPT